MFKYTSPWQVLCNSLERGSKRQASILSNTAENVHNPEAGQLLRYSYQSSASLVPDPPEVCISSRTTMSSTPKRWVMRPLTPKLENSELRSMLSPDSETYSRDTSWCRGEVDGPLKFSFDDISVARVQSSVTVSTTNGEDAPDVVVCASRVALSEEDNTSEDWQHSNPSSPGTLSSTGSQSGFYSFVEDPTSPEAEKNEAYMVSPVRQAKLSTLKVKDSFRLQTYADERRPRKLFQESNGDSRYQMEDTSEEENDEEEPDRREIIRNQAPKTSRVFKAQSSALENLDLRNSTLRMVDGFSLSYSPSSVKPAQLEVEPDAIDKQQIDFNAARKQFQIMEQSKENPFRHSPQQIPPSPKLWGRSLLEEADIFTKELSPNRNLNDEFSQDQPPLKRQEEIAKKTVTVSEDPEERTRILIDDLDSGHGTRNVSYTSDGDMSMEFSLLDMQSSSSVASTSETPIEREIRIAKEREEDLRRLRGIVRPDTSEMVEIKIKPILSQPLPQLKPIKNKETNRVSFLIQREMDRAKKSHDRGLPHDQDERRRTFSSQSDQEPVKTLRTSNSESHIGGSVTVEEPRIAEQPVFLEKSDIPDSEEILSPCCPHRHQDEALIQRSPIKNNAASTYDPIWMTTNKPKESWRSFSYINSPSSSSPLETVGNSRPIAARRSYIETSSEKHRLPNAAEIIRKEIEEHQRREQELQQLRETSNLSLSTDRLEWTGYSEPTTTATVTPKQVYGENKEHTSRSRSLENLVEVDTSQLERDKPRTRYSYSYFSNEDSSPITYTTGTGSSSRLPSMSIVTPQPWNSQKPTSPAVPRGVPVLPSTFRHEATTTPSHKGLTETLLVDFEERRIRQKLEEGSYAGIQPVDAINHEVVEVTRVIRHKSPKALRWEAGVYANEENN